jgi:hypothetical protein
LNSALINGATSRSKIHTNRSNGADPNPKISIVDEQLNEA